MEINQKPRELRHFAAYLPEVVKFYKLKSENTAKALFTIMLLIQLAVQFIAYLYYKDLNIENMTTLDMALVGKMLQIGIVSSLAEGFIAAVYLFVFVNEKRMKEHSLAHCFKVMIGNLFGVFGILALLVIPLIVIIFPLYVWLKFGLCYIFDFRMGFGDAIEAARYITNGLKWRIFKIVMSFQLLFNLPVIIFVSGDSTLVVFITSFANSIIMLMFQRLIGLMYLDLEYGIPRNVQEKNTDKMF